MPLRSILFEVFTLFPEMCKPYLRSSILQRANQRGLVSFNLHNIRDWAPDRHHTTDDEPYGGGGGMVMKPEPIFSAIESILGSPPTCPVILLTPQGRLFNQAIARELALGDWESTSEVRRLALVCGRYEGVDERVRQYLVSDEISIGDYVITGGELAALIVIDAVTRWIPGALGDPEGVINDSHTSGFLEYPHYTRPPELRGWKVPEVLLSGDHARVARWRREQSLRRTLQRRPELLENAHLQEADRQFLDSISFGEPKD